MRHTPRHHPRPGLTLVEVMVALVLVTVGLLGIAGTSALLLRTATAHAAAHRATRLATARLASLEAAGCARAADGASDDPATGIRERWHVGLAVNGTMPVEHVAEWTSQGASRRAVVRGALLC